MGIALTPPSASYAIAANGETPIQAKEYWLIPDNAALLTYAGKTSVVGNLVLHAGCESLGVDAATTNGTGFNSIWSNTTTDCNGANAFDTRLTSSVACTATVGVDNQGHTTNATGVAYSRTSVWSGSAQAKRMISDAGSSYRTWPRGIYGWSGSAFGGIQH